MAKSIQKIEVEDTTTIYKKQSIITNDVERRVQTSFSLHFPNPEEGEQVVSIKGMTYHMPKDVELRDIGNNHCDCRFFRISDNSELELIASKPDKKEKQYPVLRLVGERRANEEAIYFQKVKLSLQDSF